MNTLRTFILFIFVMGVIVLFQVASPRENSVITNSEVLGNRNNSIHRKYFYPESQLLFDDVNSATIMSKDSEEKILDWYKDTFSVIESTKSMTTDKKSEYMFLDNKGKVFGLSFKKTSDGVIISLITTKM